MDPHYPPPPIGIPTSATRGNWAPAPPAPPWPAPAPPEGQPVPPPPPHPGMYYPSYYPSPYYRHPGVPVAHLAPQIAPELLAQSNVQLNGGAGVGPPESALRNTSAADGGAKRENGGGKDAAPGSPAAGTPSSQQQQKADAGASPEQSEALARAALEAVLAFQKEQEARQAAGRASEGPSAAPAAPGQPPMNSHQQQSQEGSGPAKQGHGQAVRVEQAEGGGPAVVPVHTAGTGTDISVDDIVHAEPQPAGEGDTGRAPPLVNEDGVPILNPGACPTAWFVEAGRADAGGGGRAAELLTQVEHLLSAAEQPQDPLVPPPQS